VVKGATAILLKRLALVIAASAALLGCGGGGGQTEVGTADAPEAISGVWPIEVRQGSGHITVYWNHQTGAQAYEVWSQAQGQAAGMLSRRFDVSAGSRTWVHTVTELTPDASYTVWVRQLMQSGGAVDSQVKAVQASAASETGVNSDPAFQPTQMDAAVFVVDTDGGVAVTDRDNYRLANFTLHANSSEQQAGRSLASGRLEIRGRGNSTWDQHPKKPYRIKLVSSTSLLGMPANRHWVLLANHSDKTLLRNSVALEVSRRMNLAYTPRSQAVEVVLNGQYLGAYDLAEHVRTGAQRVDIESLGSAMVDDSLPRLGGGYLLEVDRNDAETRFLSSYCELPVKLHAPEAPSSAQLTYIQDYIDQTETALYSFGFTNPVTGYAAWIDVDRFVDWYLHSELMHHIDAFRYSTYLYKPRSGKLAIGPVWDFDLAMGNQAGYFSSRPGRTDTDGSATRRCWFTRLLQDPSFEQRVRQRWAQLRASTLRELTTYVQAQAALRSQAQANNFRRWPVLDKVTWQNVVVTGRYEAEVEYLDWWIQRRLVWMDERWRL
jgi:CotH kinase protein